MTAPANVIEIARGDADSVRWALEPDSCGLIAISHRSTRSPTVPSDRAVLVAEWFGSMGSVPVWDIAPSPNWSWLAYGTVRRVEHPADVDTLAAGTKTDRRELMSRVVVSTDNKRTIVVPVIEPLRDPCAGDDCPSYAVSPILGGKHVAWSADGKVALVARDEEVRTCDPSRVWGVAAGHL